MSTEPMTTKPDDVLTMLPCPFCGGTAGLRDYDAPHTPAYIECDACNVTLEAENGHVHEAIAAWNRRQSDGSSGMVKAIEWNPTITDDQVRGGSTAKGLSPLGEYLAFGDGSWAGPDRYMQVVQGGSLDTGKSACQSDFETRVRSCLAIQPVSGDGK